MTSPRSSDAGPPRERAASSCIAPLWLAHNLPADIDGRCVCLPIGRQRLAVCARCLALYPTLIATLAVQIRMGWGALGDADWWITFVGAAPGLLDWGVGRLDRRPHPHRLSLAVRILTGGLLGLALGRALLLYFMDPLSEVFWVLALVLFAGAVSFEAVARMKIL